ncbi:MAG: hypothetical protein DDT33_01342 [Firmicutes bacterium]|nr:hypothetical protein [Bacillota bacterium]
MEKIKTRYEESVPLGVRVHDESLRLERPLSVEEIEAIVDVHMFEEKMEEVMLGRAEASFIEAMETRAEIAKEIARIERGEEGEEIEGLSGLARDRKEVVRELALEEVERRKRRKEMA